MDGDPITNQIKKFTVGIKTEDGIDLGTGTLLTTDGIIATCFHVLKDKDGHRPYKSVKIYFSPDLDSSKIQYDAEVLVDKSSEKYDIAFLQLYSKSLPDFAKIAPPSSHIQTGNSFRGFGFSEIKNFVGLPAKGTIDDIVHYKVKKVNETDEQETIRVIKLISSEIASGISGGPIYDIEQQKVIGIASNYNYTEGNVNRNLAIAIPVELLSKFLDSLQTNIRVTDVQKIYLEEVINEHAKEFQKNGGNDKFYVENRNAALIDKAEDWEKTDEEIYQDQSKVKNIKEIINAFLDDKYDSEKLLIGAHFGVGKTSFIKKVAHDLANERLYDNDKYFPIVIFLSKGLVLMNKDLDRALKYTLKIENNNRILVIVDGLDEYLTGPISDVLTVVGDNFSEYENVKTIYTTRLRDDLSPFKKSSPFEGSIKVTRLLHFDKYQINNYLENANASLTYDSLKGKSHLDDAEISKPLILEMIVKTLPSIEKDLQRLSASDNLTSSLARTIIYMTLFYQIFLGKRGRQNPVKEEMISFHEEKRALRRLAYLKQVDKDITQEKITRWYTNGLDIDKLKPVLDSYFLFKKTDSSIQQLEKRIHFLHKSYIEFFLAEHLLEHYIHGNLHLLNIGRPSEVTIDFLKGFLALLTLPDEEIKRNYVLFDSSKSNTLFYSLGYANRSIQGIKEAIENILSTAYKSFDNENVITVNVKNTFFTNLDNSDSSPLNGSAEKLFWKENLNSEINAIENVWMSRWISLIMIQLLDSKDKIEQKLNRNTVASLIRTTGHFAPTYLKLFKSINLAQADLRQADLRQADLRGAKLNEADLRQANLVQADLTKADLTEADLRQSNLVQSHLESSILRKADVRDAKFTQADLTKADLTEADLRDAKFTQADLTEADLTEADLRDAKFTQANLRDAKFTQADLTEADLE